MKRVVKALICIIAVYLLSTCIPVLANDEIAIQEEPQIYGVSSGAETEGTCGNNVKWSLDESGTLTISGNGFMTDFRTGDTLWETGSSAPWYKAGLASRIKAVVICDGVTTIGDYAFNSCDAIETVDIPDSVTEIGKRAFANCSSLRSIELPATVDRVGEYLCYKCTSLESAVFCANKGVLDDCSFYMCERLKVVRILDGCKSIEESVFYECKRLEKVYIPFSITAIHYRTFDGCVYLQEIEYDGAEDDWNKISRTAESVIDKVKKIYLWHYVKFDSTLGSEVAPVKARHGEPAQKPEDPVRENFRFTGWILADGSMKPYDFIEPVVAPVTVYAAWEYIPPENRNSRDPITEEDYIKMIERALAEGAGDAYDTTAISRIGKKNYVEISENKAYLTVTRGNKFFLKGDSGSFSSMNPGCVKVNRKGMVSAKKEYEPSDDADFDGLYEPINFTDNGEEKTLYLDIIEPFVDLDYSANVTSKGGLHAGTTVGSEFDIAVWTPINVEYDMQGIKNSSAEHFSIKPQIDKDEETIIVDGQQMKETEYYWEYHVTGTAVRKGKITVPFSVNGKRFKLKIKVN